MILLDANVPIYAHDNSSPHHAKARHWFEELLSTEPDVRIALITVMAFVRLVTDSRVVRRPLSAADAVSIVTSWLDRPNVTLCQPTDRHWEVLADLATKGQARGALLMDAHLAALAVEHGASLATTDRDFARFPGVRWFDPLQAGKASRRS